MKPITAKTLVATALCGLMLAGCSAARVKPEGADNVRTKLTRLQGDPQLASRAPVAIRDAEAAVKAAEQPRSDEAYSAHLVIVADRKVDIAIAQAQTRLSQDERPALSEARERARLEARTDEADSARSDARMARSDADAARAETLAAQTATDNAEDNASQLERQLAELNAQKTDRGMVITLGDLLFATGKSKLGGNANVQLDKLARFLHEHPERSVTIEGHTDNTGSASFNQSLSQRRADTVRSRLMASGIAAERLHASGKGFASPISSNATAMGRQQNRRVELIISPASLSSR
jgi:outer membrane protein OmpA-like peptidoglycan-associated protein